MTIVSSSHRHSKQSGTNNLEATWHHVIELPVPASMSVRNAKLEVLPRPFWSRSVMVCMLTHRVNAHEYMTWLVQFKTCRSPKVYYYTLTACTKHSSETGGSVQTVRPRDHISNVLCDSHWLSVQYRITYKLSLLMHLMHNKSNAVLPGREYHRYNQTLPS